MYDNTERNANKMKDCKPYTTARKETSNLKSKEQGVENATSQMRVVERFVQKKKHNNDEISRCLQRHRCLQQHR